RDRARAGEPRRGARRARGRRIHPGSDPGSPVQGVRLVQARRVGALPGRGHRLGARRVPGSAALAMCGIAGIIYRNGNGAHRLGADMPRMLQSMKHRGPDSTGYALYRRPSADLIMRIKLADGEANGDIEYADRLRHRRREVEARLRAAGARLDSVEEINDYT